MFFFSIREIPYFPIIIVIFDPYMDNISYPLVSADAFGHIPVFAGYQKLRRLGNQPCLLWVARPSPCVFSFGWGPVTETLLLIFFGLRADWLIVLYFLTYRATSNSKTTKFHTWLPKFNGFKPDVGFSYESTMFFC